MPGRRALNGAGARPFFFLRRPSGYARAGSLHRPRPEAGGAGSCSSPSPHACLIFRDPLEVNHQAADSVHDLCREAQWFYTSADLGMLLPLPPSLCTYRLLRWVVSLYLSGLPPLQHGWQSCQDRRAMRQAGRWCWEDCLEVCVQRMAPPAEKEGEDCPIIALALVLLIWGHGA